MKLLGTFFRLIRYPNLLFILFTQYLMQYAVLIPVFRSYGLHPTLGNGMFFLLSFSTILVAAAGYIINDYFDINIDLVNRPTRIIVDRLISRRWAIFWHTVFNIVAVVLGFVVAIREGSWLAGLVQPVCTGLLWFYSTSYKRQLMTGNLVIALMTSLTVLVVGIYEPQLFHPGGGQDAIAARRVFHILGVYAVFAFLISMIREIVKDMEDMPGDAKNGCRTIPIAWGISPAKKLCYWMVGLLILVIGGVQFRLGEWGWFSDMAYLVLAVELPLFFMAVKLRRAVSSKDLHQISTLIKGIMGAGICSMFFFLIR
ncbi:MAG TPA: geranylgeranylglycerol-phosphate geranylgeranyltransferase [Chitinophagaceae bacterium]|nr:geranylgeranylglycerol-phosphate geranylgeranyltransferase [Chitinophagaceae bacterium]